MENMLSFQNPLYAIDTSDLFEGSYIGTSIDKNKWFVGKEEGWQSSFSPDMRNHVRSKVAFALKRVFDCFPVKLNEKAYSQRMEAHVFDMAFSQEQYYLLIAQNIYDIHEKVPEFRNKPWVVPT